MLGLHNGAVLLRTKKEVKHIDVSYSVLSRWSADVGGSSSIRLDEAPAPRRVTIPPPAPRMTLADLSSLSDLPVMVEKADAMQILHVTEEEYTKLAADPVTGLKAVNGGAYVTRTSLENFLGIQRKKPDDK